MINRGTWYASIIVILSLGLTTIWSTVPELFWIQSIFICLGFLLAFLISRFDIRILFSFSVPFYLLSIILLIVTLVYGQNIRGASRWLVLGDFRLQTSELAKPFLAIFFANFISNYKLNKVKNLLIYLLLAAIPVYLVKVQPDLGSSMVLAVLIIAPLFYSDLPRKYFLILPLILLLTLPLLPKLLHSYQLERVKSFLDPYHDPQGSGYNVIQSVIAVGSGGIIGKGVRLGTQSHLNFLPERHTDFIYASFAEEFGFLGQVILLSAYFIFLKGLVSIADSLRRDKPLFYLTLGILSVFSFQIVVNIGMNLGLMPVTGITLPLFSYGGSSLLALGIILGLTQGLLDLSPKIRI